MVNRVTGTFSACHSRKPPTPLRISVTHLFAGSKAPAKLAESGDLLTKEANIATVCVTKYSRNFPGQVTKGISAR